MAIEQVAGLLESFEIATPQFLRDILNCRRPLDLAVQL